MNFYRGTGSGDQGNQSQLELDVMDGLHKAFDGGELKEKPFTDRYIPLGDTTWHKDSMSKPDFTFPRVKIAVFLDGPPHRSRLRSRRDEEIKDILIAAGWDVHRFDYKRRTKKLGRLLTKLIIEAVNKKWAA